MTLATSTGIKVSQRNVYSQLMARKPRMKARAQLRTSRGTASRQASTATCLNRSPSCSAAKVFQNLMVPRHRQCCHSQTPQLVDNMKDDVTVQLWHLLILQI